MFDSMNQVIAALHSVDYAAVGLGDFGRPGNYMARQIARWSRQYRASETETQPAMDRLIDWLPAHLPPEGAPAIVHGDYRMDNLVFHKTEPRVIGVLDWELSTIGDPLADFAYHVLTWRVTPELFRGLAGVDFAALGIPDEAEYVAAYCRRTGRGPIANWEFYLVYSLFRLAAILQGIAKRAIDGTAASADAAATAPGAADGRAGLGAGALARLRRSRQFQQQNDVERQHEHGRRRRRRRRQPGVDAGAHDAARLVKATSAIIGTGSARLSTIWLATSAVVVSAPAATTAKAGSIVASRRTHTGMRNPTKPCMTICPASVPTAELEMPEAISDTRNAAAAAGPSSGPSRR